MGIRSVPETTLPDAERLLPEIVKLAERAAAVILDHYRGDAAVHLKADASPVTAADEAAEAVILAGLAALTPDIPVVAEETVAAGRIPQLGDGPFWLVDPLDGTKEFISKNGEFTVNIALIEGQDPVLGVVLAPALSKVWWGSCGPPPPLPPSPAAARTAPGPGESRCGHGPISRSRSRAARMPIRTPRRFSTRPGCASGSRPAAP
jgi:Inositol monophosphatase family